MKQIECWIFKGKKRNSFYKHENFPEVRTLNHSIDMKATLPPFPQPKIKLRWKVKKKWNDSPKNSEKIRHRIDLNIGLGLGVRGSGYPGAI